MTLELATHKREGLIDIADRVREIAQNSGVRDGLCSVNCHGATAADHDPGELGRQRALEFD